MLLLFSSPFMGCFSYKTWGKQRTPVRKMSTRFLISLKEKLCCDETGFSQASLRFTSCISKNSGRAWMELIWQIIFSLSAMPLRCQPSWVGHPAATLNIWHNVWILSTQVGLNYGTHLVMQRRVTGPRNCTWTFWNVTVWMRGSSSSLRFNKVKK